MRVKTRPFIRQLLSTWIVTFLAGNGNHDLIKVPFVAKPTGGTPPDLIGKVPTKFLGPNAYGLVRDSDPTRGQ